MDEFHRFMASRNKQSGLYNCQVKNNQLSKEMSHNEDEKYLMDEQQNDEIQQNCDGEDQQNKQQDDEVDPLDAFMKDLQKQKQNNKNRQQNKEYTKNKQKGNEKNQFMTKNIQQDKKQNLINEQQQISFQQSQQSQHYQNSNINRQNLQNLFNKRQQKNSYDKDQIMQNQNHLQRYDQDHLFNKNIKKQIQTLKPFDFNLIQLQDFQKDFYDQHQDIQRLTQNQIKNIRKQLQIKVFGQDIPRPIISFGHLQLDNKIKQIISKQLFQKPTPIQSQALPIALKGRDIIGVAKTGSGKTLAYLWPMITHVGHQRQSKKNQGPIGLILAPTRQLCQQIYVQTKKYTKKYNMKIGCLLGGQNKHEQWKMLRAGVDILIASPGRLIQMIKKKATNMQRVSYLVLDEADKMLSLGFEHQIRSIVSQTRPDRQTLLFTATMKQQIQFLAYDILQSPIKILVGQQNAANQNVKQQVVIIQEESQKFQWIKMHLNELSKEGKILIFCNQKDKCEQVSNFIKQNFVGIQALTLYGDKTQYQRTIIMNSFKNTAPILIATDIASRGIDVKNIKTVLNFQCPKIVQAYIHRIGRAGRAGDTGTAISFLDKKPSSIKFAISLVKIFQNSGYPVSKQLQDLACLDDFYRRKRISSKMGVSFAKGKDASKFLNQILKQQQRGNSKAGIGMNMNVTGYKKKQKDQQNIQKKNQKEEQCNKGEKTIAEILQQKQLFAQDLSVSELSRLIRQQKQRKDKKYLSSSRLKSHFVRSSTNEWQNK